MFHLCPGMMKHGLFCFWLQVICAMRRKGLGWAMIHLDSNLTKNVQIQFLNESLLLALDKANHL